MSEEVYTDDDGSSYTLKRAVVCCFCEEKILTENLGVNTRLERSNSNQHKGIEHYMLLICPECSMWMHIKIPVTFAGSIKFYQEEIQEESKEEEEPGDNRFEAAAEDA